MSHFEDFLKSVKKSLEIDIPRFARTDETFFSIFQTVWTTGKVRDKSFIFTLALENNVVKMKANMIIEMPNSKIRKKSKNKVPTFWVSKTTK